MWTWLPIADARTTLPWLSQHASTTFLIENNLLGHFSNYLHTRDFLTAAYQKLRAEATYATNAELDRRNTQSQVHHGDAGHLAGHKLTSAAGIVGGATHHLHLNQKVLAASDRPLPSANLVLLPWK